VFLDLATLEPHEDQWAYLSSLDRLSPREVFRLTQRVHAPRVALGVDRLTRPVSTKTRPAPPAIVRAHLGARVRIEAAGMTPAMLSTLKHAASMPNPEVYERQRRRTSTWGLPRFLRSYDETLDGDLLLPRGLLGTVEDLITEVGSRLELEDERSRGERGEFEFSATMRPTVLAASLAKRAPATPASASKTRSANGELLRACSRLAVTLLGGLSAGPQHRCYLRPGVPVLSGIGDGVGQLDLAVRDRTDSGADPAQTTGVGVRCSDGCRV
jgi:hypothetical protein